MSSSDANTAPTKPPFAVSAAIGSIAGATSKTATAPVERVRLLLQMSSSSTASSSSAGAAVLKQEGATGLWRGNGLAVARAMLQKGLLFATQDQLRVALGSDTAAGAVAGATAAGLTYPLDLLRTRLAGQVGRSSFSAVAQQALAISRQGGGILSLWGGASATLFGGVVFEGARFGVFGWLRRREAEEGLQRRNSGSGERNALWTMLLGPTALGTLASLTAGNFIYPNDTIRRRLQTLEGRGETYAEAAGHLLREGGVARLYRGIGLYNLKAAPSAAVQFFTYFELKRAYLHFSGADAKSGSRST